ncbi:MAG: DHH family phosphoesterase [Holophagales bacterium]|nr:DHH family phosphoesterase [Holophagales bacterium]
MEWLEAPIPEAAGPLEAAGYPAWLAAMLARRGVCDAEAAEAFLEPAIHQLRDPSLLDGVEPAVALLLEARAAGRRVAVVGDYDVDGVSGTALLVAVFESRGIDVLPILPHRIHDGYGFREVHVERASRAGCGLVVTVDCGTTSHGAVAAALAAGMGVIVTDHHLPGDPLPSGAVVINPKQVSGETPFTDLSGAGLAFQLSLAFAAASGSPLDPGRLARIACLGTIADMVPLLGENRVIAAVGLRELAHTPSPGLRALVEVARIRPPFGADDVGFRLGPRLNAPGRLASAEPSLELLLTRDRDRARQLAAELDARNRERQAWERKAAEEARQHFLARDSLPAFPVAWSAEWHRGVVGIAAGRLARELHRPVVRERAWTSPIWYAASDRSD